MTRPHPKPTPFDDAADAELARWPGVTWRREARAKHNALVLEFEGVSRFVVYTSTGFDGAGRQLHLADIRRALREIGAQRAEEPRKPGPARRRSRAIPAVTRPLDRPIEGVGPLSDPFAALAAIRTKIVESLPVVMPIPAPRAWWKLRVGERA